MAGGCTQWGVSCPQRVYRRVSETRSMCTPPGVRSGRQVLQSLGNGARWPFPSGTSVGEESLEGQ